ncbi:MAG TPA: DNA-binding protein [Porphyromonadaceae bacterium]|nr:DNA-binding protein [Porphyromonadaceae bacterium]
MNIDKLEFRTYMNNLLERFDLLDEKLENLLRRKKCNTGEELLDNQDLLFELNISPRTLQRYRSSGQLPYYTINGKIYYKLSDVNRFIREVFEAKSGRSARHRQIMPRNAKSR